MKKMVFNYRSWDCKLLCLINLLMPLIIVGCGICRTNQLILFLTIPSGVYANTSISLLIASILSVLIVILGLYYTFKVFRNAGSLKYYRAYKDKKYNYNNLSYGVFLHALGSAFLLILSTIGFLWQEEVWYKYATFVAGGISVISGIASNMLIQLFESRNYFFVYYYRHKETDVKEVLDGILASKKRKR